MTISDMQLAQTLGVNALKTIVHDKVLKDAVYRIEVMTILLSCIQVVLTFIPLITVIMELRGTSSYGWRVGSLVSLLLLAAASVAKLVMVSMFWGKVEDGASKLKKMGMGSPLLGGPPPLLPPCPPNQSRNAAGQCAYDPADY